jgi:hypothetical protein
MMTNCLRISYTTCAARKAKGIEYMVVDALKEANKAMQFLGVIDDPRKFVHLDDTLLKTIENAETLGFRL